MIEFFQQKISSQYINNTEYILERAGICSTLAQQLTPNGLVLQSRESSGVSFLHDAIDGFEDIFRVRLGEIITIGAIRRTVSLGGQRYRGSIQKAITALLLQYLLHHIRSSPSGNIFVEEDDSVGFFQRLYDTVLQVKR